MSRSLKKGPFADDHLLKKIDAMNAAGEKNVVSSFYNLPRYDRSHNRSL